MTAFQAEGACSNQVSRTNGPLGYWLTLLPFKQGQSDRNRQGSPRPPLLGVRKPGSQPGNMSSNLMGATIRVWCNWQTQMLQKLTDGGSNPFTRTYRCGEMANAAGLDPVSWWFDSTHLYHGSIVHRIGCLLVRQEGRVRLPLEPPSECRGVRPSPPGLEPGNRRFKSSRSDQAGTGE